MCISSVAELDAVSGGEIVVCPTESGSFVDAASQPQWLRHDTHFAH
jgi:hypothetical protein